MSRSYVLDASAMLALIDNRSGAKPLRKLLAESAQSNHTLVASVANWGEVFYISWERKGEQAAHDTLRDLVELSIQVVPIDARQALKAAEIRVLHHVPYVDCMAAALSSIYGATLVTSDRDFEKLGRHFPILWLER